MASIQENIRKQKTECTLGEISSEVGQYLAEKDVKNFFETHTSKEFLAKLETDIQDRLVLAAARKRRKLVTVST